MAKKVLTVDMTGGRREALSAPPKVVDPAPVEKRLIGDWAVLKGHCPVTFARKKKVEKRPDFRGDRHKGPDIRVIRTHMRDRWRTDYVRAGDTLVSEAEYDAAVNEAYSIGVGDAQSCAAHQVQCAQHADCLEHPADMGADCHAETAAKVAEQQGAANIQTEPKGPVSQLADSAKES